MSAVFSGDFDLSQVKQGLDSHLLATANQIAVEARRRCPVKTGQLRDSIGVVKTRRGYQVVAASPHAAPVEFGHAQVTGGALKVSGRGLKRGETSGHVVGHVPPHPFMRPAVMAVASRQTIAEYALPSSSEIGGSLGALLGGAIGEFLLGPVGGTIGAKGGRHLGKKYGVRAGQAAANAAGGIVADHVPQFLDPAGTKAEQGRSGAISVEPK